MLLTRAFRWMAAASQKKRRTAVTHTTTKPLSVRNNTRCLVFQAAESFSDVEIVIVFSFTVPNCVLTKELLTDGLKVLISKEDELLYAARVHTLEIPDM